MTQVYSHKIATTLKANATVAYPIHPFLLTFTKDFQRFLIDYGHTIPGLLLVLVPETASETRDNYAAEDCDGNHKKTIIPFSDDLYRTAKRYGREMKIEI